MLRRTAAATAVLALGALTWAVGPTSPASAREDSDPVAGVPYHPDWGSVQGTSGKLRKGCHSYTYSYTIVPPDDGVWAMEVFISGPHLKHVAAGAFLDGSDPLSGTGHYTLCRNVTRYGTFSIVGKVSTDNGSGTIAEGRTAETTYKLKKPRRHRH